MFNRYSLAVALASTLVIAGPAAAQQIVKVEPPLGRMQPGEKILVDNGKCPKGQLLEVAAGFGGAGVGSRNTVQRSRGGARQKRCVPRG